MRRRETEAVHIPVREYILRRIRSGEFSDGDPIDTEESLTHKFGISRRSVRTAIQGLVAEGYLRKLQGKGTFVTPSELRNSFNRRPVSKLRILVIFAEHENQALGGYYRDFIQGITYAASLKEHFLIYSIPIPDPDALLKLYEREGCSGIIWLKAVPSLNPVIKKLDSSGIPQVLINRNMNGISSVSTDEDSAFREIVDFLTGIGHRRIAFWNSDSNENIYMNRSSYFKKYIEDAGLAEDVVIQLVSSSDCVKKLDSVFAGTKQPTALILGGHQILLDSLAWLSRQCIPEALSVLCYNDSLEAVSFKTPLTVYSDPRNEIGEKALNLLEALIVGRAVKGDCRLAHGCIIARRSCAIPADLRGTMKRRVRE